MIRRIGSVSSCLWVVLHSSSSDNDIQEADAILSSPSARPVLQHPKRATCIRRRAPSFVSSYIVSCTVAIVLRDGRQPYPPETQRQSRDGRSHRSVGLHVCRSRPPCRRSRRHVPGTWRAHYFAIFDLRPVLGSRRTSRPGRAVRQSRHWSVRDVGYALGIAPAFSNKAIFHSCGRVQLAVVVITACVQRGDENGRLGVGNAPDME